MLVRAYKSVLLCLSNQKSTLRIRRNAEEFIMDSRNGFSVLSEQDLYAVNGGSGAQEKSKK